MIGGFTMKKFCVRFLSLLIILCMFSGCMLSINTQDETANAAASANDTARPMDPATANQPTAEPATTPEPTLEPAPEPTEEPMTIENAEGIIALEANLTGTSAKAEEEKVHFRIFVVDPETGRQRELNSFTIAVTLDDDVYQGLSRSSLFSSAKEWFSNDYDKIAITLEDYYTGASDAGWYDANGVYTNVTDLLGLQPRDDFDSPTSYRAIGFSQDGYFVFYGDENSPDPTHYSIPVDNLTLEALEKRNAIRDALPATATSHDSRFNDQIDDTKCLIDIIEGGNIIKKTESRILDIATGETITYVPGDGRYSWCGVASPDGSTVAFLSAPKAGQEPPSLYTMSLNGGDPVRSPASFVFSPAYSNGDYPSYAIYPQPGTTCVTLLEWR